MMKTFFQRTFLIACAAAALLAAGSAQAANCALRNPDREIYKMFPEATRFSEARSDPFVFHTATSTPGARGVKPACGGHVAAAEFGPEKPKEFRGFWWRRRESNPRPIASSY